MSATVAEAISQILTLLTFAACVSAAFAFYMAKSERLAPRVKPKTPEGEELDEERRRKLSEIHSLTARVQVLNKEAKQPPGMRVDRAKAWIRSNRDALLASAIVGVALLIAQFALERIG